MASFSKETLQELSYNRPGDVHDGLLLVAKDLFDTTRWGTLHRMIFEGADALYYEFIYELPSGDDGYSTWDAYEDDDEIEVHEVTPVERTVVDFVRV